MWTNQWRKDGASYPGTEATLHCGVVGNQLQPHTLSIRKTHQWRGWNTHWSGGDFGDSSNVFSNSKGAAGERSWGGTHWRSFLGEFSVQSVCETLDECVSSRHNHAAVQTLSSGRKGGQWWTGVSANRHKSKAITAFENLLRPQVEGFRAVFASVH